MSSRLAICAGVVVLHAALAFSQAARPSFDVTSVKPYVPPKITAAMIAGALTGNPPEIYASPNCTAGGRFYARIMLQPVILWAYDVKHYELSGVPNWMRDDPWEIEGRNSATGLSADSCQLMVKALLEDRFKLAVHREKREVSVQALVVAKGGSKLRASTGEPGTGARINGHLYKFGISDRETPDGWTTRDLAAFLDVGAGIRHEEPIVDQTGLEGTYQFNLEFSPRQFPTNQPELGAALQQQLGLKLEHRKEPMDILVIDHLERPSPN
jgi:uncharacterized protein (TIGR03435 family)